MAPSLRIPGPLLRSHLPHMSFRGTQLVQAAGGKPLTVSASPTESQASPLTTSAATRLV
jgi:hypothetical protein